MKQVVAVVTAGVVAGGVIWLTQLGHKSAPTTAAPSPTASAQLPSAQVTTPTADTSPAAATASPRRTDCDQVPHDFRPRAITVPGVTEAAAVVAPPRDAQGIPGVPPLTSTGKTVFAWDREQGVRPGDPHGNVLLNAHTWPDGTALGNRLLAGLQRGDRIVVHGTEARLCYRVTERVEVLADDGLPRYYAKSGPPQLAIVVCSGRRLGPGVWEKRTVWFASPSV